MRHKLYKQIRTITTDNKIFSYQDLDIDFIIKADKSPITNIATVKVYNLSGETIDSIKNGGKLHIEDGYENYSEISFKGLITNVTTYQERGDLVTEIIATTNSNQMMNKYYGHTFQAGKSASEILELLDVDKEGNPFNVSFFKEDLPKNPIYTQGKTFSMDLHSVFQILANDTGCEMHYDVDTVYFRNPTKRYEKTFDISANNGLLKIEPTKDGYLLQALMIPGIKEDTFVNVIAKRNSGFYKVKEVTRVASGDDEFSIYVKLEKVDKNKAV